MFDLETASKLADEAKKEAAGMWRGPVTDAVDQFPLALEEIRELREEVEELQFQVDELEEEKF